MSYRDSKGRITKNPYQFLQSVNKYKPKPIIELSQERKDEILFEMEWAREESKTLNKVELLEKYLPYYIELHKNKVIKIKQITFLYNDFMYGLWRTRISETYSLTLIIENREDLTQVIRDFYSSILNESVNIYKYDYKTYVVKKGRVFWTYDDYF